MFKRIFAFEKKSCEKKENIHLIKEMLMRIQYSFKFSIPVQSVSMTSWLDNSLWFVLSSRDIM